MGFMNYEDVNDDDNDEQRAWYFFVDITDIIFLKYSL